MLIFIYYPWVLDYFNVDSLFHCDAHENNNDNVFYTRKDNKSYEIELPKWENLEKFEKFLEKYKKFDIHNFKQTNPKKCQMCIYANLCNN